MLEFFRNSPYFTLDDDLELHPLAMKYARPLFDLIQRYRPWLRRWQNWPDRIRALNHMQQLIRQSLDKSRHNDGYDWTLLHRGTPAGKIGMLYIDWQERRTEIGYWLAPPFQGIGLMTRSCQQVLQYIFDDLGLDEVNIRCAEGNLASRAIPERLGFQNTGRMPFTVNIHGEQHYEVLYRLQRQNWQTRR